MMKAEAPSFAEDLLSMLSPPALALFLTFWRGSLLQALLNDWRSWAREQQIAPDGAWRAWVFLGGRGAGKTRAGAEWVSELVRWRKASRIALIGPTFHDVREVMIEGASGIRGLPYVRPEYAASRRRLVWRNGAQAYCFSAEDSEALPDRNSMRLGPMNCVSGPSLRRRWRRWNTDCGLGSRRSCW